MKRVEGLGKPPERHTPGCRNPTSGRHQIFPGTTRRVAAQSWALPARPFFRHPGVCRSGVACRLIALRQSRPRRSSARTSAATAARAHPATGRCAPRLPGTGSQVGAGVASGDGRVEEPDIFKWPDHTPAETTEPCSASPRRSGKSSTASRARNFKCLRRVHSTSGCQTVWTRSCLMSRCQNRFERL